MSGSPKDAALPPPRITLVSRHPQIVAAHRASSLAMALAGLTGMLAAPFYVWQFGITTLDLVLFGVMYFFTLGVGLSVGYHRHFTHGAFQTAPWMRWVMAVAGSMGGQGPLTYWVAVHRRHHECSDSEGDPHSPHLSGDGAGLRGLWHAHYGWSLDYGMPNATHYCPDLVRVPYLMSVSRNYKKWVLAGFALPTLVGAAFGGWQGALGGLLWGGLVRLFLSSNATWSLNSICHRFGTAPHAVRDGSRNVGWLALPTLGESWHNNHHAFPTSAAHGLRWWQVDLNYAFIWTLARLGIAKKVKLPKNRGVGVTPTP